MCGFRFLVHTSQFLMCDLLDIILLGHLRRFETPAETARMSARLMTAEDIAQEFRFRSCPYRKPHPASEQPRIGRCSFPMIDFSDCLHNLSSMMNAWVMA